MTERPAVARRLFIVLAEDDADLRSLLAIVLRRVDELRGTVRELAARVRPS